MGDVELRASGDERFARRGVLQRLKFVPACSRVVLLQRSEQEHLSQQSRLPVLPSSIAKDRPADGRWHFAEILAFKVDGERGDQSRVRDMHLCFRTMGGMHWWEEGRGYVAASRTCAGSRARSEGSGQALPLPRVWMIRRQ